MFTKAQPFRKILLHYLPKFDNTDNRKFLEEIPIIIGFVLLRKWQKSQYFSNFHCKYGVTLPKSKTEI